MDYRELLHTGPHIACLWLSAPAPAGRRQRVLPDACVDVVWTGSRLVVAGPATQPVVADVPPEASAFGVRFRVGAAGSALGIPAAELLDTTVGLEDIWADDGIRIAERVASRATAQAGLRELAAAIDARLGPPPDRMVRAAATRVADPGVRVEALARVLGIGDRHLRRRFAAAVGYAPKTLQRVLRFQRFLTLAATPATAVNPDADCFPAPRLATIAAEAGYADQAHMSRECSRLAGLPPGALLASGAGPAGERSVSFKTAGRRYATIQA